MPHTDRWLPWILALGTLGLILFSPFLLLPEGPLLLWKGLLLWAIYVFCVSLVLGALLGAPTPALQWLERHLRAWVARFARNPEVLWLHWARQAHYPATAHRYLDRAVQLGGREAQFQEALVFLEGGQGAGGQAAAVTQLRKAALRGHPEAAFRLAEALRTGQGAVLGEAAEAVTWYQRAANLGFGPAARWLAQAYEDGDGVPRDEAKAREWSVVAQRLQPHPPLSHSLLRHDAGAPDALVRLTAGAVAGAEQVADRVVAHRIGRWGLFLGTTAFAGLVLVTVGSFFWAGSSGLFHLPLLMASPLLLMLGWQAFQLQRDRPRKGRDKLLEAAEAGDPEACYQLGLAHRQGSRHRTRDDLSAALWFRRAAEAGHRGAMEAMAEACLGGHGVLRDAREAARWAEAARRESTS